MIFLSILILIICLVSGVYIPYAFLAGTIYLVIRGGYDSSFLLPSGYSKIGSLVLLCIPLFVVCGGIIKRGNIGDALIEFVEQFSRKFKTGLGSVTCVVCAIFGAISGSATATESAIGSILAPKLREKGYPMGVAASLIASSSVLALLIPPSSAQIMYAWATGQSVLACFLATVIPGIMLTIALCISQHFQVKNSKTLESVDDATYEKLTFGRFKKTTSRAFPALLMPVIILGGIYGGVLTPMESAAIATLYCIPVAIFVYKGIQSPKDLYDSLVEAGISAGTIMMMIMCAMLFSRMMTTEHVTDKLIEIFLGISPNKWVIMLLLNFIMIIMGMIMNDSSAIMIAAALLEPIAVAAGFSPIHFAAILGVNLGMGNITPPTAVCLYLGAKVADTPVNDMLKPTLIFIFTAWLPVLLLVIFIPEIATFLPKLILGGF